MGLFNFGKKERIQNIAFKISTGLSQIEQERKSSGGKVTPMIQGIAIALQPEIAELHSLIKPNGKTDWSLYNSLLVKWYDGSQIKFSLFEARLNNTAKVVKLQTGIDIGLWT